MISAEMFCVLCFWATKAGVKGAINKYAFGPGKDSGNYQMLALTNWSHETFPLVFNEYDFFQRFEGIVVSGVEKLIKPDPTFYQVLIDRYQINPETSLFIDDNKDNIDAGTKLGFQVIHFQSPDQLKQELLTLGLLNGNAS